MVSRRIFLKNGGLALVTLGFAPPFLARTAAASGARVSGSSSRSSSAARWTG